MTVPDPARSAPASSARLPSGPAPAVHGEEQAVALGRALASTLESITDGFFTLDRAWRYTYVNAECERLMGRPRGSLQGRVIWDEFPAFVHSPFHTEYVRALAEGVTTSFEGYSESAGRWFDVRAYPAPEGISVYFRDVSERKAAQREAQRDAEARMGILRIQQELAGAGALDLQQVMELVATRTRSLMQADGAEIELLEDQEIVCRATAGDTVRALGTRIGLHTSLAGRAVREQAALYCEDVETDPHVDREVARRVGARSILVTPLQAQQQTIGVLRITARRPGAFAPRDIANLQILTESLGAVIERHRIAGQLQASEAQYRLLFEHNPHPMWVLRPDPPRFLAVNQSTLDHYGYTREEFLALRIDQLWVAEALEAPEDNLRAIARNRKNSGVPQRHRRKDGTLIDVEISADAIVFDGEPARLVLANDVTERLRAERDVARLNRAQRMLSSCNEALIRTDSRQRLLDRICEIAVNIGGYRTAWVGLAQDEAERRVLPVARAGFDDGFLDHAPLSWAEHGPRAIDVVGQTVRDGVTSVIEDLAQDARIRRWRPQALASGYRGLIALPLREDARCFGALVLYAGEVRTVGLEEIALLEELANDLAFGIVTLQAREQQRRLQAAVLTVASAVSHRSGDAFFDQLAEKMATAVGAQGGCIARFDRRTPGHALVLADASGGIWPAGRRLDLRGTPAEALYVHDDSIVAARLAERFPQPATAQLCGAAQAFVGQRLARSTGEALGMLCVWFDTPRAETHFIASTLRIFAARAAAEMERQEADAQLRDQASLLDKAQDAIIVRHIDHRVRYWNRSAERLYGYTTVEAVGRTLDTLLYEDPEVFRQATQEVLRHGEWSGEIVQRRRDGDRITVEDRWTLVRDAAGEAEAILAIGTDISQRKEAERAVHQLAFYDTLTGLPNRQLLTELLHMAHAACKVTGRHAALLLVDLDHFKTLNSSMGHERGDQLLKQLGQRLGQQVRKSDTVARVGGDEFLVLVQDLSDDAGQAHRQAQAMGENLLQALRSPCRLDEYEHICTSSVGVTLFGRDAGGVGELLKQTDLALHQAKAAGRNTLRFFDPQMQRLVVERARLEAELRLAVQQRAFALYYQPQADADGRVIGFEALVRWPLAGGGMVSPAAFIPLAEETGLILDLGQWVLETACELLARWRGRPGLSALTIAVNVSSRQFHHHGFVDQVVATLQRSGADPRQLKLELTESLLVDDMDGVIARMAALKQLGLSFSLDDFGTGYSSLAYLKRLPLDQLKIDQSFVREVLGDANGAAIARTIIALSRSLRLDVIAEGVETEEQRAWLQAQDCHHYQGYLLSRPLALPALLAFLQQHQPALGAAMAGAAE